MKNHKKLGFEFPAIMFIAMCALALIAPSVARAGLVGPYPVDSATLHLYHFAETNLTPTVDPLFAYDSISNQDNGLAGYTPGGLTLTNCPGPDMFAPTEFATNGQPSLTVYTNGNLYVSYNYSIMTTQGSCYCEPFTNNGTTAYQSVLYTNIANYVNTNSGAFTFEALVSPNFNPLSPGEQEDIIMADSGGKVGSTSARGWFFDISSSGQINFQNVSSPSSVSLVSTLPSTGPDAAIQGQWYHVAVTYSGYSPTNGDTAKVLKEYWTLMDPARTNCDLLASFTNQNTSGIEGETPFFAIGGSMRNSINIATTAGGVGSGAGWDGYITEVRISNVRRGPDQMAFNYTNIQESPTITCFVTNITVPFGGTLSLVPLEFGSTPMTNQWYQITANGVTNALASQTNEDLVITNAGPSVVGTYFLLATNAYGNTNSVLYFVSINTANFDFLYNSGVDNNGNSLQTTAPGSPDLHWSLIQDPDPKGVVPNAVIWSTNYPISPNNDAPGYLLATPTADWIGPEENAGTASGTYEYQTTFLLDEGTVSNASLSGEFQSAGTTEGENMQFVLNGVMTLVPAGTYGGGPSTETFVITNGFQSGSNVLDIILSDVAPYGSAPAFGIFMQNLVGSSYALTNAPVITNQPSSIEVNYGATAQFSVVAFGAPFLSYEWLSNTVPVTSFSTTNRVLTFVATNFPLSAIKNGVFTNYYKVIVTNNVGSVTSSVVELTVNCLPAIIGQTPITYTNLGPTNLMFLYGGQNIDGTNYLGSSPTFGISTTGLSPFYYQWFTNGVGVGGATNSSFSFPNCQLTSPTNFVCVVSNLFGSVTSAVYAVSYLPAPMAPFPQAVLAGGAAGYWRLNEAADDVNQYNNGEVCDDYISGNNGIYTNTVLGNSGYSPTTDPSETSAWFGADAGASCDANSIGTNIDFSASTNAEFTVSVWANGNNDANSEPANAGMFTKGYFNGEEFTLDNGSAGGDARFEVRNAASTPYNAGSSLQLGNGNTSWNYLVGVCDESHGTITLYTNGVPASTVAIPAGSGVFNAASVPIMIGARSTTAVSYGDQQFNGLLDDAAVFNYALSPAQVAGLYNAAGGTIAPYFIPPVPVTNISVLANSTLTIPVTALGTPPVGYYWTNLTTSAVVAIGATNVLAPLNSTFTYNNIPASANQFELIVTNAYGMANITFNVSVTNSPVNSNPTNIVATVTNNTLYLTWPADHTGWQLQAQTNPVAVGIYTNWANYNPSTGTNQVAIPVNLINGTVFYRLIYTP